MNSSYQADKELFVDPIFKADQRSLSFSRKKDWSSVEWLRPQQVVASPKFYVEGNSRFDVKLVK